MMILIIVFCCFKEGIEKFAMDFRGEKKCVLSPNVAIKALNSFTINKLSSSKIYD
jgi:hypothetical protein